jgi:poly(3-hydroxybutyrate) depolymerase
MAETRWSALAVLVASSVAGCGSKGVGSSAVASNHDAGAQIEAGSDEAGSSDAGTTEGGPPIPQPTEACPTLATGNVTVMGQMVQLWVGTKQANTKGAVYFYWHGTGSSSGEAALLGNVINEITSEGGILASFSTTTAQGQTTGNNVWYTGDFAMADEILACAVQQLNIDTRRIYVGGCSAGGLQASAMVYLRSSYIAAAMPNSGGKLIPFQLQDSHVPALITTHGQMGTDVVVVDFSQTSAAQDSDIASRGGFVVDCNHGGRHCGAPADDIAAQWQFCKDHPFGVSPEPYANGLPSSFPSYCSIIK